MSLWIVLQRLAAVLAFAAAPVCAGAEVPVGADTAGGLVPGARVLKVTTRADAGPGSLRAALAAAGPRVVVFEVGGEIALAAPLTIGHPQVTVAGQTAPDPGVTLAGASLIVRASDVVLEHIAVRRGPGGAKGANLDAISIGGGDPDRTPTRHVRLSHVSAAWGVDETIGIAPPAAQITVEHAIVAESLRNAGHPEGAHANGLLIGRAVEGVAIRHSLFVSNAFRNPVVGPGASALVLGNVIVNPQHNAAHLYKGAKEQPTRAAFIANLLVPGPDTRPGRGAVSLPPEAAADATPPVIYVRDNCVHGGGCGAAAVVNKGGLTLARESPVAGARTEPLSAEDRRAAVLAHAGARPGRRDAVDVRLIAEAAAGGGRIVDRPPPSPPPLATARTAEVPVPIDAPLTAEEIVRLKNWLCRLHQEVGGAEIASCAPSTETGDGERSGRRYSSRHADF